MRKKEQKGFTLAETLITLGVIGVVAALTLPILIQSWQKKFYLSALRKRQAEFMQVLTLSIIKNGTMSNWNWGLNDKDFVSTYIMKYIKLTSCENCWITYTPKPLFFEQAAEAAGSLTECNRGDAACEYSVCGTELGYPEGCFLGISGVSGGCPNAISIDICQSLAENCENGNPAYTGYCDGYFATEYYQNKNTLSETPDTTFALVDGTTVGFTKKSDDQIAYLYLDLNGAKSPNKYGLDKFILVMSGNHITAFGQGESDLTSGKYGCSDAGNKMYCGAMIIKNNWDYPANYPKI